MSNHWERASVGCYRVSRLKIRMWRKNVFGGLLLWFCLHFFHGSFAAHWDACWFTSTRLINDHYEPTFFTFIFCALLCHSPSPPRGFTSQKSRVFLGYKLFTRLAEVWERLDKYSSRFAPCLHVSPAYQRSKASFAGPFWRSEVGYTGFLALWRLLLECASLSFCRWVSFLILFSLLIASALQLNSSTWTSFFGGCIFV